MKQILENLERILAKKTAVSGERNTLKMQIYNNFKKKTWNLLLLFLAIHSGIMRQNQF